MVALLSQGKLDQALLAFIAQWMASSTWEASPTLNFPKLCWWSCGGFIGRWLLVLTSFEPIYNGM